MARASSAETARMEDDMWAIHFAFGFVVGFALASWLLLDGFARCYRKETR